MQLTTIRALRVSRPLPRQLITPIFYILCIIAELSWKFHQNPLIICWVIARFPIGQSNWWSRSPLKFNLNPFIIFQVMLPTDKQTNVTENITFLAVVTMIKHCTCHQKKIFFYCKHKILLLLYYTVTSCWPFIKYPITYIVLQSTTNHHAQNSSITASWCPFKLYLNLDFTKMKC